MKQAVGLPAIHRVQPIDLRQFFSFLAKVTVAHVVTYFVAGSIAYELFTKPFYEGPSPIFTAFFRSPAEPDLWSYVMQWFIPGQILRGLLIGAALHPFFDALVGWSKWKRWLSITGLYVLLGFWAAAIAAPGNIEGMVYLRPTVTPYAHLMVQPEIVGQGLALGAWIAWWMGPQRTTQETSHGREAT